MVSIVDDNADDDEVMLVRMVMLRMMLKGLTGILMAVMIFHYADEDG